MPSAPKIAVIGLGYVGLPLAVALARHFPTLGFDIDQGRIAELRAGRDRTDEVAPDALRATTLALAHDPAALAGREVYIITVPTPVDADNRPDLTAVRKASETVGRALGKGAIVVYESTVYPGVTEEICGPLLAQVSGLAPGRDFFLGYSPERINPGDREHTVDRITKVVAGETPAVTETLALVYGKVTTGGVFRARDIKTAEAAKVIENAQRDINIAFINEVAMIFQKMGLSAYDVLEAAGTKWNFLKFTPGLVGGHCIGVDPFYLAHRAEELGHHPAVILAGRRINDAMGAYVADRIADLLAPKSRVLVLGLTFKENVPDLRNSKVIDVIRRIEARGHAVALHDPLADPKEAKHEYGVSVATRLDGLEGFDALVGAVPHRAYTQFGASDFNRLVRPGGLIADIKGMWRGSPIPETLRRWQL
ncbi:MAG: nucleotide sugar dehydrogenase [Alphaproteobacteria bacterium]|nr:nucleotide sugar dehydrogenase [Alphaproteobacteria bacterium]